MKNVIFFLLMVAAGWRQLNAQSLRTSVDWAIFDYGENTAYIELYYSFPQSDLTFKSINGTFKASTLGQFKLLQKGSVIKSYSWKAETAIPDTSVLGLNNEIIDKVAYVIPSGEYDCRFLLTDLNAPASRDSMSWQLKVPSPLLTEPHLSEIEIAKSIRYAESETNSPFYKNKLIVEPNPSLVFSFERPALFFYLEAYQLPRLSLDGAYYLKSSVTDGDGAPVPAIAPKSVLKKNIVSPSVEFGMLNVGTLNTGKYSLQVEIVDSNDVTQLKQSKSFYVLQKEEMVHRQQQARSSDELFATSPFAAMDSSEIELEFQIIYYLLAKEAQAIHKQINQIDEKRHFLFNFWQLHRPELAAENSRKRQDYFARYRWANERYKALGIEGWQTDRGRVFMLYGPPDDTERYPNEANKYPYEIWNYNDLQNGVIFVFADLEGYNNYRLIHSDLLGEINDPNYGSILTRGY